MIVTFQMIRDALMIDERSRDSFLLYGSYARGDYDLSSDIDVLRITTSRKRAQRIDGRVVLHIYDIKDLLEMAAQGSLFILHLIREAKPLQDPRQHLRQLSAAFQEPESYACDARRRVASAASLLDIDQSLFETAPRAFMNASIFLCRTLVYAEHADKGPFSFSLRSLATNDENASLICRIKDQSLSYSDFLRIRRVVRRNVESREVRSEASSIYELAQRGRGNSLFDGLLRRIVEGLEDDGYVFPNISYQNSLQHNSN